MIIQIRMRINNFTKRHKGLKDARGGEFTKLNIIKIVTFFFKIFLTNPKPQINCETHTS